MDSKKLNALFIVLIAPIMGEVYATSTPILYFINPINFLFLTVLYGFGALIIRELMQRWGYTPFTWSALIKLGIVYGITEEGIFLWSFFQS